MLGILPDSCWVEVNLVTLTCWDTTRFYTLVSLFVSLLSDRSLSYIVVPLCHCYLVSNFNNCLVFCEAHFEDLSNWNSVHTTIIFEACYVTIAILTVVDATFPHRTLTYCKLSKTKGAIWMPDMSHVALYNKHGIWHYCISDFSSKNMPCILCSW